MQTKVNLLRRVVVGLGRIIVALGLLFLAFRIKKHFGQIGFDAAHLPIIAFAAAAYGAAGLALAVGWLSILRSMGQNLSFCWSVQSYGISQIAKYVPGNVFHVVSRHIQGAGAGVPHAVLLKAAGLDIFLLVIAGACLASGVILIPVAGDVVGAFIYNIVAFFFVIIGIIVIFGKQSALALLYYMAFLFVAGVLFVMISCVFYTGSAGLANSYVVFSAYTASWLLGIVTPGAPAGLGVREAAVLVLMDGVLPDEDVLAAVLLFRIVTVMGDGVFFGLGVVARHLQRK